MKQQGEWCDWPEACRGGSLGRELAGGWAGQCPARSHDGSVDQFFLGSMLTGCIPPCLPPTHIRSAPALASSTPPAALTCRGVLSLASLQLAGMLRWRQPSTFHSDFQPRPTCRIGVLPLAPL